MVKKRQSRAATQHLGQIRIIAGQWRGRKLTFANSEGLRPTADRIRETVFNWLAATVPGARCLDLFAGSGALALEALSRGASHVDLIEAAPAAAKQLQEQTRILGANNANVWQAKAQQWLKQFDSRIHPPYDIVFIDPPFRQGLVQGCVDLLIDQKILSPHAWIYLEMGAEETLPCFPQRWRVHREKTAGQVCYRLIDTKT